MAVTARLNTKRRNSPHSAAKRHNVLGRVVLKEEEKIVIPRRGSVLSKGDLDAIEAQVKKECLENGVARNCAIRWAKNARLALAKW
jgi:hypothetical protein